MRGRRGPVHLAVATRSFRRHSTYVGATLAGIFTNCVFGLIMCAVYLAVWEQRPDAGGYDTSDALTYVWLGQALLMTVALWGGGTPDDLAARVKSGDVVIDFLRPAGILGWYVAADLGRAAYHLLTRGLVPMCLGFLLFDLTTPGTAVAWAGVVASLPLAVLVSFGLRMLVALSTFWLFDDTGPRTLAAVAAVFWSGLTVPLVLFPGALRDVAMALPWAAYLQVPADIWLGHRSGAAVLTGLLLQASWAAALLALCALTLRAAERRVVVQGG